jgi:hypothetical protein
MAGRHYNQFSYGLEKYPVTLFAEIVGAGASVPLLKNQLGATVTGFHGIKSITRNGAGDYTITLQDTYQRFLDLNITMASANGSAPTAYAAYIKAVNAQAAGGATINFITYGAVVGTPVEMSATTDKAWITITASNSTAV